MNPTPFTVRAETALEKWRVETFWTKEPGTIRWLNTLGPDDVLLDVGANIGLYSMYGALRVKHVYACEPSIVNAAALIRNVVDNGMQHKVTVLTSALSDTSQYCSFAYRGITAGGSGHQVTCPDFQPMASELKRIDRLDDLIEQGAIQQPTAVKIDVDGHEYSILQGFAGYICGVRTIQVEVDPLYEAVIMALMTEYGFAQATRHETASGEQARAAGKAYPYNQIYERVPVTA